jgi:two-component system, sensor histidine kinase and response regulator
MLIIVIILGIIVQAGTGILGLKLAQIKGQRLPGYFIAVSFLAVVVIRLAAMTDKNIYPDLTMQSITLFTSLLVAIGMMAMISADQKIGELEDLHEELTHYIIHDLKNPLTTIFTANGLLLSGETGKLTDQQRKIVGNSQSGANHLLAMILNILDARKIEIGKIGLEKSRFSVGQLKEAVKWVVVEAGNEGKRVEIAAQDGELNADLNLIGRVLENLLMNAIKHTPKGGVIKLTIKKENDWCLFEVSDNGEGIPQEALPHIFDKFYRVEHQKLAVVAGVGLGLSFCKIAVEAHGGTIKAESEPGRGSKFSFSLPC